MMTTRPLVQRLIAGSMAACTLLPAIAAAQDRSAERAARRTQLQMQQLQKQVQDAQAAQARSDADMAEARKKLSAQAQEIPRAQAAARQSASALKASEAARAELQVRLDALQKQAAEQKRTDAAVLSSKVGELEAMLNWREGQQRLLQGRFDNEFGQVFACTDKNQKLIELGAELLDRYRRKGLAEIASQHDPVLGLGQVEMFNLVQDYRDRADAQRFAPPTIGQPQP